MKRGLWFLGVLVTAWVLYWMVIAGGALKFVGGTRIEPPVLAAMLAIIAVMAALILSFYQAQWRRVSGGASKVQRLFRFIAGPLLVGFIPVQIVEDGYKGFSPCGLDGCVAFAAAVAAVATYVVVVAGKNVFVWKADISTSGLSEYQIKKERANLTRFHIVIAITAIWTFLG